MAVNSNELALGQLVSLTRGTTYKSALLGQPGPVLLGLASIKRNGGFRDDNLKTYGGECPEKLILKPGDIYVSLKDVTQAAELLGAIARVPPHIPAGRVTQDTVKLTFTRHDVSPRYVYWMLRTPTYREYCRAHAIGTTNLALPREDFLAFPMPQPSDREMSVVEVLDALDDKIELNRRMNATLEAMARALFQSWFVDFDPVRAKLDGRQPVGLDQSTTALFPDSFQDSELGPIPKGWEVCSLADKIELLSGGTPKTSEPSYWDGDIPWYSVKDAPAETDVWVIHTEKHVTKEGIANSAAQILAAGTSIISARGTVGKLALIGTPLAMNQSCYGVRGIKGYSDYFTYFALRQATADLQQRTHGTVFDTITRQTFETLDCIFPPASLTTVFDRTVAPLLAQIRANLHQSHILATLRDTLLPKLLSGELRVEHAAERLSAR